MKLLFKQRFFSWLDSYDIYDETGETIYSVKGQLSFGHRLHIHDRSGNHIATVKQVLLTFLPKFELYKRDQYIGCISKEFTFFSPKYNIDFNGWQVQGHIMEWDYEIYQGNHLVATVSKELWNFTDTYSMDIQNPQDALCVLMLVLAIDAEKCSRN